MKKSIKSLIGALVLTGASFLESCASTNNAHQVIVPSTAPSILASVEKKSYTNGEPICLTVEYMTPVKRELTERDKLLLYVKRADSDVTILKQIPLRDIIPDNSETGRLYKIDYPLFKNGIAEGTYSAQAKAQISGIQISSIASSDPRLEERAGAFSSNGQRFYVKK